MSSCVGRVHIKSLRQGHVKHIDPSQHDSTAWDDVEHRQPGSMSSKVCSGQCRVGPGRYRVESAQVEIKQSQARPMSSRISPCRYWVEWPRLMFSMSSECRAESARTDCCQTESTRVDVERSPPRLMSEPISRGVSTGICHPESTWANVDREFARVDVERSWFGFMARESARVGVERSGLGSVWSGVGPCRGESTWVVVEQSRLGPMPCKVSSVRCWSE